MSKAVIFVSFAAGALVGSLAGVLLTKESYRKQYEEKVKEDTESVIERFHEREKEIENVTNERIEKRAYELMVEKYKTSEDKEISEKKKKGEDVVSDERPYVIAPDEVGETGYRTVSLNYYDDGVLTYENDDVIENVDELVGKDSLSHFGEYEDDTVYVRNDKQRIDYEILADTQKYSDIYC